MSPYFGDKEYGEALPRVGWKRALELVIYFVPSGYIRKVGGFWEVWNDAGEPVAYLTKASYRVLSEKIGRRAAQIDWKKI